MNFKINTYKVSSPKFIIYCCLLFPCLSTADLLSSLLSKTPEKPITVELALLQKCAASIRDAQFASGDVDKVVSSTDKRVVLNGIINIIWLGASELETLTLDQKKHGDFYRAEEEKRYIQEAKKEALSKNLVKEKYITFDEYLNARKSKYFLWDKRNCSYLAQKLKSTGTDTTISENIEKIVKFSNDLSTFSGNNPNEKSQQKFSK